MSSTGPTVKNFKVGTVFDRFYFSKQPNYKCVDEYLTSLKTAGQRRLANRNNGDNIERNVEITNYLMRRQLAKTTKRLENMRKKFNEQRKKVKEQWNDLQEKENSLRQNFVRFNQFVKENQEKKERAANKLTEQNQLKEERQRKMEELLKKLEVICSVKVEMDKKISQYRIYEEFLLQVVEKEESIAGINDLLKRYEALIGARKELNDMQQADMMKLEKAKSNLMKLIEEKNFVIMGLNNQIANLQARYENANIKALESEELVTQIKNNAVKQMGEIDTVKNSIWNVYVHMASSKKHPVKIKKDNVEEQMMYINRTLTELNKVNKLIKKKATKAATK
ncbi:coiled-coil domain-containing protein 42-like isoform X2 [Anthonomus grandis grandis]|uniref:coiled-coil domain-containing protein 42-like isoform X2 n=1 Tax=Anthonomus grandis grandis TaxID=2921223 RepID=UPI002165F627|nr:coiled-coil domain-containing protein 42-like isoform X2 [Anthonomus grandis grandis]